ncbi:GntR family transcriptional regulator [Acrocarpospora catenulata]|uniref:GntR family transcriptional regulator n=1 Tax=Acrocarpospora catenulata TaxID=2836182 RepID=UPI001BD973BA|nr:GntR family transcriptional regulator [Acrocarpospora catenulata]
MEIKAPVARWKQVADYLREQIANGTFPAGQLLPSEQQLATDFGLSRPTIRQAIAELKAAGLVEVHRPTGMKVRSPSARPSRRERHGVTRGADGRYTDRQSFQWRDVGKPTFFRLNASVDQAEMLGIPAGEPMLVRSVVQVAEESRRIHKTMIAFSVAQHTPWADDARLPEPETVYSHFEQNGKRGMRWDEFVRARMPFPDEVDTLAMGPGTPLLQVIRLTYADQAPVVMEEISAPGDALELAYAIPVRRTRSAQNET